MIVQNCTWGHDSLSTIGTRLTIYMYISDLQSRGTAEVIARLSFCSMDVSSRV